MKRGLILLLFFLAQGAWLIPATSPTADEVVFHMVNGYTYLRTGDYRMSPANPALGREWMALPWLVIHPKLDLNKTSWTEADSVPFAKEVFYKDNRGIANRLLYSSRFMVLLLGLATATLVFIWSRALYGEGAAFLSLSFFTFCPTFLGHSSIGMTDVPVAFFVTLCAFFVWRYLEQGRAKDLWLSAFSFGFACAMKQNALLFGPVLLALLGLRGGFKTFLKSVLMWSFAAFLVIWVSYGFETKPLLAGGVPRIGEKLAFIAAISDSFFPGNAALKDFLQGAALKISIPIPTYLMGVAGLIRSHQSPYLHYEFGQWTTESHWYFYLFSFAVKMTLPFLTLLFLRIFLIGRVDSLSRNENRVILFCTGTLFFATFFDSTAVGVRYLFPVIPMLFVWVGAASKLAAQKKVWVKIFTGLAIINALQVLTCFPDYLSYFNPLVGGARGGYRYVRGSDVDWGQGLKRLKHYLDEREIEKVSLEYFGSADPSFYGIRSEALSDADREMPGKKIYAISLFYREHVRWADEFQPTALVGGCMLVYDFTKP